MQRTADVFQRKFFYVFTGILLQPWVTLFLLFCRLWLLIDDWRGYILAFFVIAWLANQWMSLYRRLRVEIKHTNVKAKEVEKNIE
jgi:hypothetical protein